MSAVFKLAPDETFIVPVPVPVPGQGTMALDIEFRHQTGDAFKAWVKSVSGRDEAEALNEVIVGWHNADGAYSVEALRRLLADYPRAAVALLETYMHELTGARLGN